jgi:hypothetical protein
MTERLCETEVHVDKDACSGNRCHICTHAKRSNSNTANVFLTSIF